MLWLVVGKHNIMMTAILIIFCHINGDMVLFARLLRQMLSELPKGNADFEQLR